MPIYEFYCPSCRKKSSVFTRAVVPSLAPRCTACGSGDLVRLVSSFAYHKSIQTIHEESGEPTLHPSPDYYKDPRNIGRWVEKRFTDMGMELPGEIQQKIQAAREGEMPEPLKDLQSASPDASYH
ncbi:MAG: hypothetical protein FJ022_02225 [Chloroflexi bacterium]|nr:hypothetical protein [Chloroflexota bacterium]MBM3172270.1 hypothetical protein [Chloroflexota bacterium]MBM3174433.1 hypothetical protein [Chloroflexota bacterium]MBM4449615.1 hypothetical protein [Chloroflexota bacterium]